MSYENDMSLEKKHLDFTQHEAHQRTLSGVYSDCKMKNSLDLEDILADGSEQVNTDPLGIGDISLKLVVNVSMSPQKIDIMNDHRLIKKQNKTSNSINHSEETREENLYRDRQP
jgi:hypothetical protein